jgi:hypothetical protein|tara:strand:- start:1091 stop:1477 length:387 start_codon:yes stop_codon:yes gene_type:complete
MKLSNYLTAINHSKKPLMDTEDELVEKEYAPYIVNRCLSYFIDTILHVNQINEFPDTAKKMQFDYLQNSIRKRKRFSKWQKKQKVENIEIVKEYYGYSNQKATEIMGLLSDKDIEEMRIYLTGGGTNP